MGTNSNLVIIDGDKRTLEHASYDGHLETVLPSVLASVASYGLGAIRTGFSQAQVVPVDEDGDNMNITGLMIDAALVAAEANGKTAYGIESFLAPGEQWNCKHPHVGLAVAFAPQQTNDLGWGDGDLVVDLDAGTVFFSFDWPNETGQSRGLRVSLTAGWEAWDPDALAQAVAAKLRAKLGAGDGHIGEYDQSRLDSLAAEIEAMAAYPQAKNEVTESSDFLNATKSMAYRYDDDDDDATLDAEPDTLITVVFKLTGRLAVRAVEAKLRKLVRDGDLPAACLSDDAEPRTIGHTDLIALSSVDPDSDGWCKVVVRFPGKWSDRTFDAWGDRLAGLGSVVETYYANGGFNIRHPNGCWSGSGWMGGGGLGMDLAPDSRGPQAPSNEELSTMTPVRSDDAQRLFWAAQVEAAGDDIEKARGPALTMLVQALVDPSPAAFAAMAFSSPSATTSVAPSQSASPQSKRPRANPDPFSPHGWRLPATPRATDLNLRAVAPSASRIG